MQIRNIFTLAAMVSTGFAAGRVPAAGGLTARQVGVCSQYSLDTCTDGTCYNQAAGDLCCPIGGMCPVGYNCGTGPNIGYCCPEGITEAECADAPVTGSASASDPESTSMVDDNTTAMVTTTRRSSATATSTRDSGASASTRSATSSRASETATNGAPRMVTDGSALAAMAAIAGIVLL